MDNTKHKKPIRIIVVDDSHFIRQLFASRLSEDPMIDVVATAEDAFKARELIKHHNPDMITLDIEMPGMDGISFLEKLMKLRPMPVIMASTLTAKGTDITIQALEIGAIDYITKPSQAGEDCWEDALKDLVEKIKMAAIATIRLPEAKQALEKPKSAARIVHDTPSPVSAAPKAPALGPTPITPTVLAEKQPVIIPKNQWENAKQTIIAMGASTGGVEALNEVLCALPKQIPPIVITQHMPPVFTASFAKRLDAQCEMKVVEAQHQQKILPGHVYIAPGSHHLHIHQQPGTTQLWCQLDEGEEVSGHRPSVDAMFNSLLTQSAAKPIGVILTGMGKDGAAGLLDLRKAGATTLGQNEASCVVYGMPRAAMNIGAVNSQCNLKQMADAILNACKEHGYD